MLRKVERNAVLTRQPLWHHEIQIVFVANTAQHRWFYGVGRLDRYLVALDRVDAVHQILRVKTNCYLAAIKFCIKFVDNLTDVLGDHRQTN